MKRELDLKVYKMILENVMKLFKSLTNWKYEKKRKIEISWKHSLNW